MWDLGRGFALVDDVVTDVALASYRSALGRRLGTSPLAGVRDLFAAVPETRALVDAARLRERCGLGSNARIVRAILFDKAAGANWHVPWHQDLFVATTARVDVAGFSAWTTKDGVAHAKAPREILDRMLAVRIHIDSCPPSSGPLRVLPGSHDHGVLDDAAIGACVDAGAPVTCSAAAGSALLLRPLLLHASSRATSPTQRRVVHLEIADCDLPAPLAWHSQIPL